MTLRAELVLPDRRSSSAPAGSPNWPITARRSGLKKPLLVTDKALASLPITARALDILDAGGPWAARCSPKSTRTRTKATWTAGIDGLPGGRT